MNQDGNATIVIENGEQVYPCRCGQTHRGDYAAYDYAHHNCFHDEPLIRPTGIEGYLLCPLCGRCFFIDGVAASDTCTENKQ